MVSRVILLLLSLFATLTLLVAVLSTARAFLHAQSSSYQAPEARRRAVSHWTAAVLAVVVTMVVRARLSAGGGDAARQESVSVPWRAVGLVAAGLAAVVAVVIVVATVMPAAPRRHARNREAQRAGRVAQQRIESAAARHEAVLDAYGAHLVGSLVALERPALNHAGVAETERFDRPGSTPMMPALRYGSARTGRRSPPILGRWPSWRSRADRPGPHRAGRTRTGCGRCSRTRAPRPARPARAPTTVYRPPRSPASG